LPSSLTRVSSIALVFSTRPPVSVLVRARGPSLGAFLGGMVSGTSDVTSPHPVSALMAGFRPAGLRSCPSTTNGWDPLSYPVLPSVITVPTWYGNINPLSIAYAFRPRLRSRLTLRRLALLRNPWAFGGGVSSPLFRYSCQHSHSRCLHGWVTPPLQSASGRSPTTPARPESAASVPDLSPATLSAREHLTSELLRTLSRVAASKPTSWLSVHPHIVYHLVRISGP
jgi:hypothetical protein